ncbi:hypothetical protein HK100_006809 [Physocladia obscura]|uniref:Helicase ATP-binding domain-containing protein n=1 Tax=Physocladia obscura TaxID=109957 RepID=A0AAD5T5N6_9FUNG|nr:hypothetical protein HK100_006809 [Physocladia obscura]
MAAIETHYHSNSSVAFSIPGGILCEEMGTGKTLIVIALIAGSLSTAPVRNGGGGWTIKMQNELSSQNLPHNTAENVLSFLHWKKESKQAPIKFITNTTIVSNQNVPSLVNLCLLAVKLSFNDPNSIPDHLYPTFNSIQQYYSVPIFRNSLKPARGQQQETPTESEPILLSNISLIVVPDTLANQWINEFNKHVSSPTASQESINRLDLVRKSDILPPLGELQQYNVILITHTRLKIEAKGDFTPPPSSVPRNKCDCSYKGKTREKDCRCPKLKTQDASPFAYIHFKRIIFDEGHLVSYSGLRLPSTQLLEILATLKSEFRWVCSGTPLPNILIDDEDNIAGHVNHIEIMDARQKLDLKKLQGILVDFIGMEFLKTENEYDDKQ